MAPNHGIHSGLMTFMLCDSSSRNRTGLGPGCACVRVRVCSWRGGGISIFCAFVSEVLYVPFRECSCEGWDAKKSCN